jgi:hypothetical protein
MSIVLKHQKLSEAVKLAYEESSQMNALSAEVLQQVVLETIHKYQQKLNVGVEDSISDLIDTFKQKVSQSIFDVASGWRVYNRDYFLFPRGCRFCFAKGENVIAVVEQEPQIRSLLLDGRIIENEPDYSTNSERIALALPYVNFVLHFKNQVFVSMYCGWRTSPLRDINDSLCTPLLPNIHDTLQVCMGKVTGDLGTNISQRTDAVIGHFWNSKFNSDLSTNWQKKSQYDARFSTARTWSDASIIDSSFVLQCNYKQIKTVKSIIDLLTTHDLEPDENHLRHTLTESIDTCVEAFFNKVMRYFKNTKFEKHHPKDVTELVKTTMIDASTELATLTLALERELQNLKQEIILNSSLPPAVAKSPMWSNYSDDLSVSNGTQSSL